MNQQTLSSPENANWNYPTDILFGVGRVNELSAICNNKQIRNPLLVTDFGLANFDFIKDIKTSLKDSNLNCEVFCEVKNNPNGQNIAKGVIAYNAGGHDGVIAIGGGSALDAGKAIALMVGQSHSIWDFEDIGDNWLKVNERNMAPVIAIPTTAGTGSEVGRASVIVDEEKHLKKIIFHPNMLPATVILDPRLTQDLPPHLTAATGLDAFVHCLEAYCAPGYHPMAEGIAIQAMTLIKTWLPIAFENGSDLDARGHMLTASCMGATAFQKGLGGVHALAHPLGAIFDKHHGLLNAIILPFVLIKNRLAIEDKMTNLCAFLSIDVEVKQSGFDAFLNWLMDFRASFGIPSSLSEIGIEEKEMKRIGEMAFADPSAQGNPISLSPEEYAEIFSCAVKGDLQFGRESSRSKGK